MPPIQLIPGYTAGLRPYLLLCGQVEEQLALLAPDSVQCVVTSPPYYLQRDYGVEGQIGLEPTYGDYVARMVGVFRQVWRVLRPDGICFVNLGDSYARSTKKGGSGPNGKNKEEWGYGAAQSSRIGSSDGAVGRADRPGHRAAGLADKQLMGIPWRVALALQDDGWYLRQEIIWCLSGGTELYCRSQKGDMPMTIKDIARLKPGTVKLWNGQKWTRLLGMSKSARSGKEVEIRLRSGERISCTPNHKWPTNRGLLEASEIRVGDILETCRLPEPDLTKKPLHIGLDAAWFAGLYLAEGCMTGDKIHLSGHVNEIERWERVKKIAADYGGSATLSENGNRQTIHVHCSLLTTIVRELVGGKLAYDKSVGSTVWRYSNEFLDEYLNGYLSGDGGKDTGNRRWRLGFARNYNLERDLRVICARLGYSLTLSPCLAKYQDGVKKAFRGEIRKERSGHFNEKDRGEVMAISWARCRYVYDIGVEDEPHLYSLASGVLTHNSKPSPMPESVKDRCCRSHEHIFVLAKSRRYYWDHVGMFEPVTGGAHARNVAGFSSASSKAAAADSGPHKPKHNAVFNGAVNDLVSQRTARSVWRIAAEGTKEKHFAAYPTALVAKCLTAGVSPAGCCPACFAPRRRVIKKHRVATRPGTNTKVRFPGNWAAGPGRHSDIEYDVEAVRRSGRASAHPDSPANDHRGSVVGNRDPYRHVSHIETIGWEASCKCGETGSVGCLVLDPFSGTATTGRVAVAMGHCYIGIDLSEEYTAIAHRNIARGWSPKKEKRKRPQPAPVDRQRRFDLDQTP